MPSDVRTRVSSSTLRTLGLAGPVAFVALILAVHPLAVDHLGTRTGSWAMGLFFVVAALAFGAVMYWLVTTLHASAVQNERRAAALEERERIARELHDSLAQVLGVTHLRLHALAGRPAVAADPRSHTEVRELAELCHEGYVDVREAILGLRDATRDDRTLREQLEHYVAAFSRTSGIPTTLVAAEDALALPPAAEVQAIRIIQEALTNVRKHADATHAAVTITAEPDGTRILVADDGRGFDPARTRAEAFGLTSMRDRTASVGGRLTLDTTPGGGTRVIVDLPGRHTRTPEEALP